MSVEKPARTPGQTITCGWCRNPIPVRATGRLPKWCSPACRQRAWEQRRAAASGLAAVEIVDRFVEVERVVHTVERVEVPTDPTGADWAPTLLKLAEQLHSGRLYDRDLNAVAIALNEVLSAMAKRPVLRRQRRSR